MPFSYSNSAKWEVVALRKQGFSWGAIVKRVHVIKSKSAALRIWKKYQATGCFDTLPGSGPKPVIRFHLAKKIDSALSKDPWISPQELVDLLHLPVSAKSVQRYRAAHYHPVKGIGRPVLSGPNKLARLRWCQQHLYDNFDDVIFTDEKSFMLFHNRRLAWIKPGAQLPFRCQPSHVPRVQVLGGISRHGQTSLVCFEGWLTATRHQQNLHSIAPSLRHLFRHSFRYLQDNDPSHSARTSKTYLASLVPRTLHLPAQSPDLNPIEHVWSAMDARVSARRATTRAQLQYYAQEYWRSLTREECNRYIDDLKSTMKAIIAAGGDHVHPSERRRYRTR